MMRAAFKTIPLVILVMIGLISGLAGLAPTAISIRTAVADAGIPEVVTIAVPPEGTSGYIMATGYSGVISKYSGIKKTVLQPFSGSAGWPARMNAGEVNFGQHCGFEQVMQAYEGTGPFSKIGPQRGVQNMCTGYGLPWGIHVIDPAIESIEQLKGRTLFVQVSHSDHVTAVRVMFKAAGLDYDKDIKVIPFRSPAEAVQGLLSGRADGIAYGIIPGLTQVQRTRGLHSIPISDDLAAQVKKADPVWGSTVVGKGQGALKSEKDLPVLEIECGLAAGEKTSTEAVYQAIKAIYEHYDEWKKVHFLARQWTLKKATEIRVVPFHEGAVRYYKEKGVWTSELEEQQKALLKK
jgi:TRAP transporter TAXI family solute receptor